MIVYTKTHCPQCNVVKIRLDNAGVYYETKDLTHEPEMIMVLRDEGATQFPVVKDGSRYWWGVDEEKLQELGA
tara:strand:- start:4383 stop:4601 length:219 start_codon:yes stop_codon:yes gene_type:complete